MKTTQQYKTERPIEPNSTGEASYSARFKTYLADLGLSIEDPGAFDRLDSFLRSELPEPAVMDAVKELRWQFARKSAEPKQPYPGQRAGGDPIEYLMTHYRDDIREGRLNSGRLNSIDAPLFQAVYHGLKRQTPRQSVAEFLDKHTVGHSPHDRIKQRTQACATLLGTDLVEASRFFSSLRVDRASKWTERVSGPQSSDRDRQ